MPKSRRHQPFSTIASLLARTRCAVAAARYMDFPITSLWWKWVRTAAEDVIILDGQETVEITNLSAEPLGKLHSRIPRDLKAEQVVFPFAIATSILPNQTAAPLQQTLYLWNQIARALAEESRNRPLQFGEMACLMNIASRPTDRNVPAVRSRSRRSGVLR
jgi:hypothetical protein